MKTKHIIIGVILLISAGAAAFGYVFYSAKKIEPGNIHTPVNNVVEPKKISQASLKSVTEWYQAVGTVRPRTETRIESQVTAQVKVVNVKPGDKVLKNQVIVSLDDRQLLSRLDQAKQGLKAAITAKKQAQQTIAAAEAAYNQAESAYKRTKTYFESQAATSQDMENALSRFLQAKANLSRAKEALIGSEAEISRAEEVVKEGEIALGYTRIRAPETGEVLRRLVEPGDMALSGKPLIVLQTRSALRLEAYVREGLIQKVKPGRRLKVSIQTLNEIIDARVEEIVPYADPQTRTFLVKAILPDIEGLYPGMYGKLLIPVEEHQVVVIPRKAVRKVGQLELVRVKENNAWKTRFIKTGRSINENVEVLSGLAGSEIVAVEE